MVRLRTHTPEGIAIQWYYKLGGDYLIIPIADYEVSLHGIVLNHPNLSEQEKAILYNHFVYAIAVDVDDEGNETPYLGITFKEFDQLYSETSSGIWKSKVNPSEKFQIVEIPRMFDYNGERDMIKLLGKGYESEPKYSICVCGEEIERILEPSVE